MSGGLKPGDRLGGRYLVENLIAEGGMASIYRARDEHAGRYVAVKVLYPYYGDNEVIRARFVEEGNIQRALGHPNVVHVLDIVMQPLAIVMEEVDGPTLDDYLAEQGQLSEEEILDLAVPIMSALGLAHSKGIIHRDLKPSNILLHRNADGSFEPKVMDFGVAKVKDAKNNLTATGTTVGTLHYMSPEQIVGSKTIDGRADIYSLGVTLYKLATGEVPFNAPTEFALMMAQVEAPPLPPSKLRAGLSPELESVILRAMEKKPVDRFQTIRQFTTALLEMKRGPDSTVRETITQSVSQELIDIAMSADQVAQDRTSEMSLRVIQDAMLEETSDTMNEPTIEIASARIQAMMDAHPEPRQQRQQRQQQQQRSWTIQDEPTQESTVELTSSELIRLSADGDATLESDPGDTASIVETEVLKRRNFAAGDRPTVPSGVQALMQRPGTGSLISESVETVSLEQRVALKPNRVVVLEEDVDSRDLTSPKMKQNDLQSAINSASNQALPRPSGPKVVLGYNPADTEDKTFEKPNFRTRLPIFETSKSKDDFDNPIRHLRREARNPPLPEVHREEARPPSPEVRVPANAISDRIDAAAQSAIRSAEEHQLPRGLLLAGVIAVFVILGCVLVVLGYWLLV